VEPGLVTRFAGVGNRMKFPEFGARSCIVGSRVARIASLRNLANSGSQHDDIPVDQWNAIPSDLDIDGTIFPECRWGLAGQGVDGHEPFSSYKKDARRCGAVAGPERNSASSSTAGGQLVFPDQFARLSVERENSAACGKVHHVIHDDGRGFRIY